MKYFISILALSSLAFSCNGAALKNSMSGGTLTAITETNYNNGSEDPKSGSETTPPAQPTTPSTQPDPTEVTDIPTPVATQPAVIGGTYLVCNPKVEGAECDVFDKSDRQLVDPEGAKFYVIATDLVWKEAEHQRLALGKYFIKTKLAVYAVGIQDSSHALYATWVVRPQTNLLKNGSFEDYSNTINALFETTAESVWRATPFQNVTCPQYYVDIHLGTADIPAAKGNRYMDLNGMCDADLGTLYSNHKVSQSFPAVKGQLYQVFFSYSGNPKATSRHGFDVYWNEASQMGGYFESPGVLWWTETNMLKVATSDQQSVGFRDSFVNKDSAGGLIDDVQVYGLGFGPSPE